MKKAPSSIILFAEAQQRGLEPTWISEYGFFCFQYNQQPVYVYQTKFVSNNQFFTWLTTDKHACKVYLEQFELPVISYCFTTQYAELENFFDTHQTIIAKPTAGQRSEGVVLVTKKNQLTNFDLEVTLFERYEKGSEYRFVFFDNQIVAIQKKELAPTDTNPWFKYRTNLTVEETPTQLITLAEETASHISQTFFAIDLIWNNERACILELNSTPGISYLLHPNAGKPTNLAPLLLDHIIATQTT